MSQDHTWISIQFDPLQQRMTGVTRHGGHHFNVPFMSHIFENLWTGGCQQGLILPRNILHLVSLYPWERYSVKHELDSELHVKAYDADIEPLVEHLDPLVSWVTSCLEQGPTLVHCQAGLNRSGLVAALVLKRLQPESSFKTIIDHLRIKRSPAVLCNESFESYLLKKDEE